MSIVTDKRINIPSWCASIEQVQYIEHLAESKGITPSQVFCEIVEEIIKKYGENE